MDLHESPLGWNTPFRGHMIPEALFQSRDFDATQMTNFKWNQLYNSTPSLFEKINNEFTNFLTIKFDNTLGDWSGIKLLKSYNIHIQDLNTNNYISLILEEIKKDVKNGHFHSCSQKLNQLCGETGFAKMGMDNQLFHIHLNFTSDYLRSLSLPHLNQNFEKWQFQNSNFFRLTLSPNQTAALFGIDPNDEHSFLNNIEILKEIQQHLEFLESESCDNLKQMSDLFQTTLKNCGMQKPTS